MVITAGGRLDDAFAAAAGTRLKALVPLAAEPLLRHVLRALAEVSGRIGPVVIVGPTADLAAFGRPDVQLVPEAATGPENMALGLEAVLATAADTADPWTILATCDTPLIDGPALRWLLDSAPSDAQIVLPILTRPQYDAQLPGSPNTYVRLADGEFTASSVFLVRPRALLRRREVLQRVFDARKSQVTMARLLGLPFVARLLAGRLTSAHAESRATELSGCVCRVLRGAPAVLAADVDTLEDLRVVEAVLARRPLCPRSIPIQAAAGGGVA
jgi:CTP:molybdopterin cytidylyltransferase MocA